MTRTLAWVWLVGLLVGWSALAARPVAAAASGSIKGTVSNGTASGSSVGGQKIVLHIVGDGDRVERRTGELDAQGRYRFDGLETDPSLRYLPVVEFQGAAYFPKPISLAEQADQTADFTVYDGTTADQLVAFERSNLMIQGVGPNQLSVMEMGAVANVGDRTYLGAEPPSGQERTTLRFATPPGALDLAPQVGFAPNDFNPTGDGFAIGSPVVPGRHQLAYSYSLPFSGPQLEVSKRLEYPTLAFSLYLPDIGLQVDSPQLRPGGQTELGGQKFQLYTAQNLPRGTEIRVRLSGLPVAGPTVGQQLAWPLLAVGCAAGAFALAVVYRRRTARPAPVGREQLEGERVQLLVALARLDDRFERGEVDSEQYQREREVGTRRLLALSSADGPTLGAR